MDQSVGNPSSNHGYPPSIPCAAKVSFPYYIVDFTGADNVLYTAAMPNTWLFVDDYSNQKCVYPDHGGELAAARYQSPVIGWPSFYCRIRHGYADYLSAKAMVVTATNQSDINTDWELRKTAADDGTKAKRVRTENTKYSSKDFVVDGSSSKKKNKVVKKASDCASQNLTLIGSTREQGAMMSDDDTSMIESVDVPSTLQNSASIVEITEAAVNQHFVQTSTQITGEDVAIVGNDGSSSFSLQDSASQVSSVVTESDWEKRMEAKVNELAKMYFKNTAVLENILAVMNDCEQKLSTFKSVSDNVNATETNLVPPLLKEPLQDMEDLPQFEAKLADPDNYYQIRNSIRSLGGTCVSDALKRAWNFVFSLKVCANVNWHGKKKSGIQKFGLKDSIIKKVVFDGVRTTFKLAKDSELEVETIKMMKVAPEKYRKKTEREKQKAKASVGEQVDPAGEQIDPAGEAVANGASMNED